MKYIKINDELLQKINKNGIKTIAIINDQDDLSLDDSVQFFNETNVSFGLAKINQINLQKFADLRNDTTIKQIIVPTPSVDEIDNNSHVKIISFEYKKFAEPKSISSNTTLDTTSLKIFADGGSRGNPGPSASGYVILTKNDEIIKSDGVYLGITTNNQAEYKSIKFALEDAIELGGRQIAVFMDSLLVINQLNGKYKIKNFALIPIYKDIKELVGKFDYISFTHVPREFNKLADNEVNKCLDNELNIT